MVFITLNVDAFRVCCFCATTSISTHIQLDYDENPMEVFKLAVDSG